MMITPPLRPIHAQGAPAQSAGSPTVPDITPPQTVVAPPANPNIRAPSMSTKTPTNGAKLNDLNTVKGLNFRNPGGLSMPSNKLAYVSRGILLKTAGPMTYDDMKEPSTYRRSYTFGLDELNRAGSDKTVTPKRDEKPLGKTEDQALPVDDGGQEPSYGEKGHFDLKDNEDGQSTSPAPHIPEKTPTKAAALDSFLVDTLVKVSGLLR